MCRGCKKHDSPHGAGSKKLAAHTPGNIVKLKYLGDPDELVTFEGAATRTEYVVGGRVNLVDVYASDTATGISWAPGLLELRGEDSKKLFKVHVPLKEEVEAEARAHAMQEEAWKNVEALVLPPEPEPEPEESPKPKRRKARAKAKSEPTEPKVEANGEDSVPGD